MNIRGKLKDITNEELIEAYDKCHMSLLDLPGLGTDFELEFFCHEIKCPLANMSGQCNVEDEIVRRFEKMNADILTLIKKYGKGEK